MTEEERTPRPGEDPSIGAPDIDPDELKYEDRPQPDEEPQPEPEED